MQKLFAVILAVVVGFGAAGCLEDEPAEKKSTVEIAQEVACELVVPIIDAVVVKMRAGVNGDGAATISVYNRSGKTATLFAARGHSGDTHTVATSAKGDLPAAWQSRARSLTVGPIPTATPTTPTGPSTPKSSAPSSSTTTSSTTTPPTGSSSSVN
ncbi:hypothetical protein [Nocardia asteroides]